MAEKFGFGLPRVHVGADARAINQHGFQTPNPDVLTHQKGLFRKTTVLKEPANAQEAAQVWLKSKAERYALDAILINRVVERAVGFKDKFPPFGLMTEKDGKFSPRENIHYNYRLLDLQKDLDTTLQVSHMEEMNDLELRKEEGDTSPEVSVYKRAVYWADFYQYVPHDEEGYLLINAAVRPGGPFVDYRTGIGTATSIMRKTLQVIPEVCESLLEPDTITPELFTQIARNSYASIAELAAMGGGEQLAADKILTGLGISHCMNVDSQEVLLRGEYVPHYFTLKDGKNGKYLSVNKGLQLNKQISEDLKFERPTYAFDSGCPAVIPVEGDAATKKLWDMTVDVYSHLVRQNWESQFEPIELQRKRHNDRVAFMRSVLPPGTRIIGIDF